MKNIFKNKLVIAIALVVACFTTIAAVNKISVDSPVTYPTDI